MAFNRAKLPVTYTRGFNPLAKIEITAPLSTGISADAEIAAADFAAAECADGAAPEDFVERLNLYLPEGIHIENAESYLIPGGAKKHSLSSLLWGFCYEDDRGGAAVCKAAEEKQFRQKMAAAGFPLFQLRRTAVLAKDMINKTTETGLSYFDVFRFLYPPGM